MLPIDRRFAEGRPDSDGYTARVVNQSDADIAQLPNGSSVKVPLLVRIEQSVTTEFDSNGAAGDVVLAADVIDRLTFVDGALEVAA